MFVAASTECWPGMEFEEAIEVLTDLEFTAVEIAVHESGTLKPSQLLGDPDRAVQILRHTHRLEISSYSLELGSKGEQHYEDFKQFCRIAKTSNL